MARAVNNFRLFFQGALLSYVALFRWLRPVTYMASKVLLPLNQMLFFTLLGTFATGRDNAHFYVIGNAIQVAAVSGIFGVTFSISGDRWEGTLAYLFGTPANRLTMFIGRAFMHVIDGMLGVFIGLFWGVLLLGLDLSHTDPGALLITIFITTFSTSGLGLLLGCLSLITRNVMFVNNTVYFLLLVFSGANIPRHNFAPLDADDFISTSPYPRNCFSQGDYRRKRVWQCYRIAYWRGSHWRHVRVFGVCAVPMV